MLIDYMAGEKDRQLNVFNCLIATSAVLLSAELGADADYVNGNR